MRPVYWSITAQRDNLDIVRHIAQDNPNAAERVVDAIEDAGNKLGSMPTGVPGRVTGTYEKPLSRYPYIIAYAFADVAGRESIVILRIIHMARDWPSEDWPQ